MSKRASEAGSLGPLIERLGPLNNKWRQADPPARALTLWDMGEVILAHVANPSDALLWEVHERSYITRTVLRYALIVRRGWNQRAALDALVRDLRSYTVFREALPFLKGDREGIDDATYRKVVSLLSSADARTATEFLRSLKGKAIGRKHKKGVAVASLRGEATIFVAALTQLENEAVHGVRPRADSAVLLPLSQMAMVLAADERGRSVPPEVVQADGHLGTIAHALAAAFAEGRAGMAAFRKVVGAERLMAAADFFNSMRSDQGLADWRRRHSSNVTMMR